MDGFDTGRVPRTSRSRMRAARRPPIYQRSANVVFHKLLIFAISLAISYIAPIMPAMRLILDTAAMVATIRSDAGASRRLLVAALERRFTLLASVPLMIEYQAVMTRPEHLEVSGLSVGDMDALLDAVAAVAEPVRLAFLWRPMVRDPDDDMVLEAAVNGNARAIVTFNIRDFGKAASRFGIDVVSPGEAWKWMEARK